MIIGINGQSLSEIHPAGPEKYNYFIINALSKIDRQNNYKIYLTKKPPEEYFNELTSNNNNFKSKPIPSLLSWTQIGLSQELYRHPVDVYFTSVHTMPVLRRSDQKVVAMVHGLEYKYSKEYTNLFKRPFVSMPVKYVCENATHIIVPSQATKSAILLNKWHLQSNKISVVPEGVSDFFYKRSDQEIKEVRQKHNLGSDPYILFISTIQPRKNLPALVQAFSIIARDHRNLKLVVVGKAGWLYQESLAAPAISGVQDKVVFLGRVDDPDIPPLLSGAKAYVSVSFEEGFGLTLLEAMACETPAVVSDIQAYKDVGEDAVTYVNPKDVESIEYGLLQALNYNKTAQIQKAKEVSRSCTWESTAQKTLEILTEVAQNSAKI